MYTSFRFIKRFRLNKKAFEYVINEINLSSGTKGTSINPVLKLAMTLELLGKGSYQDVIGNDYTIGMAQSTVSKILWNVVQKIVALD